MMESREAMVKRLYMRSIRRGIKEMDLILKSYADDHLSGMNDANLALYDALLSENDHDIYGWITGHLPTPATYLDLITAISAQARGLTKPA